MERLLTGLMKTLCQDPFIWQQNRTFKYFEEYKLNYYYLPNSLDVILLDMKNRSVTYAWEYFENRVEGISISFDENFEQCKTLLLKASKTVKVDFKDINTMHLYCIVKALCEVTNP